MRFRFEIAAVPLFATATLSAALAVYAWKQRPANASVPLALMLASIAEWSLCSGLEAMAVGIPAKVLLSKLEYIGTQLTPVFLLLLATEYSRARRPDRKGSTALLFLLPVINFGMAATNDWHYLVWSHFTPADPRSNLLVYHHGPWFWVSLASIYAYLVAAGIEFVHTARQARLASRQTAALLVSMLPPMLAGIVYSLGYTPLRGLNLAPIALFLSAISLTYVFRRLRLLDLVPVPRETLIENMPDAVLVLDPQGRVVDHNPAAVDVVESILGNTGPVAGQSVHVLGERWPAWAQVYDTGQPTTSEIATGTRSERQFIEVQNSPLYDRHGDLRGHVTLMRDVTERSLAIAALRQSEDRFRLLAEMLSFPLLLASLDEHTVLYANPVAERLLAKSGTSLTGSHFMADAVPQQERMALWREVDRSSSLRDYELKLTAADGHARWMTVSTSVACFQEAEVLVMSMADITQRKQAEHEREQLIAQLKDALASIKTLSGLVPICASCKKIRDDRGYWHAVEMYVSEHSGAEFTHGLCPDCERALQEQYLASRQQAPSQHSLP